ncbi:MAG: 4Fe-4S dicluster domain-containing protein [Planctomycetota bacterium]|nr:MAG: 4Fe-4S dicluster domain-containing protein [Planctomycetota bacterium]
MVSRRGFFTEIGRSLARGILAPVPAAPRKSARLTWVRPPGALPEPQFLDACTRCTDCLLACPHQSIRKLGHEFGDNLGTPAIIPDESPCHLCEGLPCVAACTTGALVGDDPASVRMATAVVDEAKCYSAQGQPCDYCVERCPIGPAAIRFAGNLPVIQEDACSGCGVCVYLCPANALHLRPASPR